MTLQLIDASFYYTKAGHITRTKRLLQDISIKKLYVL